MSQAEEGASTSSQTRKKAKDTKSARNVSNAEGNQTTSKGLGGCGFCCFKFKEKTSISALEFKIAKRQKKFGVDYLTMVEQKEPQTALKQCLKTALKDVAVLEEKISDHRNHIETKKAKIERPDDEPAVPPSRSKPVIDKNAELDAAESQKPKKKKSKKPAVEPPENPYPEDEKRAHKKKTKTRKKKKNANIEDDPASDATSKA